MRDLVGDVLDEPFLGKETKKALIQLEELSDWTYRFVFLLTYTLLAVGTVLMVTESYFKQKTIGDRGFINDESVWEDRFVVTPLEMFFSIEMRISRIYQDEMKRLDVPLNVSIILDGYPGSHFKEKNVARLIDEEGQIVLRCEEAIPVCVPVILIEPEDYRYKYQNNKITLQSFRASFDFNGLNVSEDGVFSYREIVGNETTAYEFKMDFSIKDTKKVFGVVNIVLHGVFALISIFVFMFWFRALTSAAIHHVGSRSWAVVAEQKWVTYLLFALFCFQGPFFLPWILKPSQPNLYVANGAFLFSVVSFLIFSLLIVDSVRENASRLNRSQITKNLHSFPATYYLYKVLLGLSMFVSFFLCSFMPTAFAVGDSALNVDNFFDIIWMLSFLIAALSVTIWIIWICFATIRAHSELEKLPYLETRFRQLSFRFFIFQTSLLLVYVMVQVFIQIVHIIMGQESINLNVDAENVSIGTLVLFSAYVYIVVFIYWPASNNSKLIEPRNRMWRSKSESMIMQSGYSVLHQNTFSLDSALMLLDFSYQSYDADDKFDESGVIALAEYGFSVTKEIVHLNTDTKCVISCSDGDIVLCFRGTASIKNAQTNLLFSRSTFVFEYPGPLDPNGASDQRQTFIRKVMNSLSGGEGSIHSGFMNAYQAIQPELLRALHLLTRERVQKRLGVNILLTGHSLGGALATVCAFDIAKRFPRLRSSMSVYTFGSPRVGDHIFAAKYNQAVPRTFRFVCDRDVITRWPKFLFLFKHVGIEILIDRYGNHIVNPSIVERQMRLSSTSLEDHKLYSYREGILKLIDRS